MTRHLGTVAAATLALASACAADASQPATQAAIPPAAASSLHGRIADSTHGGDIWVMNANGSGRRRVTRSGRGTDFDPWDRSWGQVRGPPTATGGPSSKGCD
jgi:opacity protein-like surface antigen